MGEEGLRGEETKEAVERARDGERGLRSSSNWSNRFWAAVWAHINEECKCELVNLLKTR